MLDLRPIETGAILWAQVVAFVGLLAAGRAWRRRAQTRPVADPSSARSVLLVRPCAGREPRLAEALSTSRAAASLGARVVLAVDSRDDEAYPVATEAVAELGAAGVEARVVETRSGAVNAKSGQLAAVLRQHEADLIVVADSDVALDEATLAELIAAVQAPGVGAAWVPPAEVMAPQTPGDRMSQALLCGSLHAFPVLSQIDAGGLVGKLFAVRREALAACGGFEALTDVLGEDMELARRLRARGFGIVSTASVARSLACGRTVSAVVERYGRWLQVIRAQRPALLLSYPLLFFPTLPLLALAAWGPLRAPWAAAVAALTVGGRLGVGATARWMTHQPLSLRGLVVDAMLADGLLLSSFVRALSRRSVAWRGRSLMITSRGRLVRAALPLALTMVLGASGAWALPAVGGMGKNVNLEDADGRVTKLETLLGKPILIVYEDKDSAKVNQAFKDELSKLAKGDKYKTRVALAAVADLTDYNYWPVKGFVKDSIRSESKKIGTTIFCDWDGHVRVSYAFTKGQSSIVLLNKQGKVIFAAEGRMSADDRKRALDLLKAEVEG